MLAQGDVFLIRAEIPKDAVPCKPGRRGYVLAEGEATGHAHTIEATPDVELYERNGTLYLRIKDTATVVHEEHKPITVAHGDYEVGQAREYDPFEQAARRVAD